MTFSRKRQTFLLIILTAATLMPAYSLQGWLASGHAATELPFWFWIWETVAWSMRALIEAGAILYLFETNAQTHAQERALLFFKVALIVLITLTLGPVVASAGLGKSIPDALPLPLFWLWSFAIASYAPLMLGSVGMAYRVQPHDANAVQQLVAAPVAAKEAVAKSKPVAASAMRHASPAVASPMPHASSNVASSVMPHASPAVASLEFVAPKVVAAKGEVASVASFEAVATSAEIVASPEFVAPKAIVASTKLVASPELVAADEPEIVPIGTKLWDDLGHDEARWAYCVERKAMGIKDAQLAAELGVHRSSVGRLKDKVAAPLAIVTNGHGKDL